MIRSLVLPLLWCSLVSGASAEKMVTKRVSFKKGADHAILTGKITGRDIVIYKLGARDKQFLEVTTLPEGKKADFNIYIPGRGPGDEALFASAMGGQKYLGQLYKTGDHTISVFQNRAAARRGDKIDYKIMVRITDKQPVKEEVPAVGPVPKKVIEDCLKTLRTQIPDRKMKVIRSKRGETSFIVDVKVEGVPEPWRCFHDGTKCTGTEYQGEG